MRVRLHDFPSVSLEDVDQFTESMEAHARPFAHQMFSRNPNGYRTEETIFENTKQGSRAKVAACLANERDPDEMVDWICVGGFSPGYMYLGENESYVVQVKVEDLSDNKITISIPKNKYNQKITKNISKGSYCNFTEFVAYDSDSKIYFHLGRISNEDIVGKQTVESGKWDYILECEISPIREDGLLVLL